MIRQDLEVLHCHLQSLEIFPTLSFQLVVLITSVKFQVMSGAVLVLLKLCDKQES